MREQERVLLSVNGLMFQSPLSTTSNQFPVWFETNHLLGWIEHGNLQTTFSIRCVHGNQRGVTVKITHETLCHRYYELSHSSTSKTCSPGQLPRSLEKYVRFPDGILWNSISLFMVCVFHCFTLYQIKSSTWKMNEVVLDGAITSDKMHRCYEKNSVSENLQLWVFNECFRNSGEFCNEFENIVLYFASFSKVLLKLHH